MEDLKDKKIIYTFDTWEDYDDLMQHLEDKGVTWVSGAKPTKWHWLKSRRYDANQSAVSLTRGYLSYGSKEWYQDSPSFIDCEKIHWKKREKKDISLADFLGWEEDVKYRRNGNIYKVDGNHLKILKNDTRWINAYTQTWELIDLRNASKVKFVEVQNNE